MQTKQINPKVKKVLQKGNRTRVHNLSSYNKHSGKNPNIDYLSYQNHSRQAQWCTPVIPVTQGTEAVESKA
jgi:hypothetical protein